MILNRLKYLSPYKTETTACKIKLSSNENPFDLSDDLKDKIMEELKKIPFQRYPDPESRELKEIIGNLYGVSSDNLVLGNGSDELIHLLVTVAGDLNLPVMFPVPTFPMYQVSADVLGRTKYPMPLDENFDLRPEEIEKAIAEKSSIAFFARPNNPTGNSFNRELILKVADQNVLTVVDEAYIDFSEKKDFLSEALGDNTLIVIRTLSKIGLAGIRLGVLIAQKEIARTLDKARAPFNITYPGQVIAKTALTKGIDEIKNQVKLIKNERNKLSDNLNKLQNVKVYPSDANFIMIKLADGELVFRKLIESGILVRNMSKYANLKDCLRISVGKPEENKIFIEKMKEILKT